MTISIAPSASGSQRAQAVNQTDRNWARDHDAYRRLRKNGLQPPIIDGCGELETRATTQREIEHGHIYASVGDKKRVEAAFDTARELAE